MCCKFIFLSLLVSFFTPVGAATAVPEDVTIKKIAVESRDQAKKVLGNHQRYLKLLFEQSRDPYYGKFKWSEDCLKKNVIGTIVETKTSLLVQSELLLDSTRKPGVCVGKRYSYGMIFCDGADHVNEFSIPHGTSAKFTAIKLCE